MESILFSSVRPYFTSDYAIVISQNRNTETSTTTCSVSQPRGCICQLSDKIGIREEAVRADFSLLQQVQSFRPAAPETQDPGDPESDLIVNGPVQCIAVFRRIRLSS